MTEHVCSLYVYLYGLCISYISLPVCSSVCMFACLSLCPPIPPYLSFCQFLRIFCSFTQEEQLWRISAFVSKNNSTFQLITLKSALVLILTKALAIKPFLLWLLIQQCNMLVDCLSVTLSPWSNMCEDDMSLPEWSYLLWIHFKSMAQPCYLKGLIYIYTFFTVATNSTTW
jgi:hypothetical protein